jgi:biopolymer transport protein TolR
MAMNFSSGGGRTRGRGRARAPMAEINVTPLVDIMLVLLIIFMVTAPLLVSGVPVELPETSAKALDQKKEPIEISIDKEGAVFVDAQEPEWANWRQNLMHWRRNKIRTIRARSCCAVIRILIMAR